MPNVSELDHFTGKQTIYKNKSISIRPGESDSRLIIKSLQKKKTVYGQYIEIIKETVDSIKSKIEPSLLTIYYLRPKESVLINFNDVITFCNKADNKDYFKKNLDYLIIIILYQILLKWEKDIVIINYYYNYQN